MLRIFPIETRVASTAGGRRRCARPAAHSWPTRTVLRMMCEALQDGLAAHRHYEQLRSRGVAHDSALRQALAIAPAPAEPARERIMPLCFAGRA
jgi:hypothetical protein